MRRLAAVAGLALALAACKRAKHDAQAVAPEQESTEASVVNMSDPGAAAQLVRGFYTLEAGVWRWTMKNFEVTLKSPPGASENGARLTMRLTVPEAISSKLGPVTLKAAVNGLALDPETYAKPGDYVYSRDVPAAALKGDPILVQFACDKAIEPSPNDARELALIAVSIGLEPK